MSPKKLQDQSQATFTSVDATLEQPAMNTCLVPLSTETVRTIQLAINRDEEVPEGSQEEMLRWLRTIIGVAKEHFPEQAPSCDGFQRIFSHLWFNRQNQARMRLYSQGKTKI
jgi:hypothetical protein